MKIKLLKPHLDFTTGSELDFPDTMAKYMIDLGLAIEIEIDKPKRGRPTSK